MQKFVLKGLFSTRRIRYKGFKGIRGVNLSKLGIRQEKKETLLGKFLGPSYNFSETPFIKRNPIDSNTLY